MITCSQMGYSKPVSYQSNDATSSPTAKEFRALSMVYAAALGMHSEIFKTFFKASIFFQIFFFESKANKAATFGNFYNFCHRFWIRLWL